MTPVRVLWLIKGLGPGGAERLLVSLADALTDDHHDEAHGSARLELHVAYLLPWKQHLVPELEAAGVPVHLLSATGRAWDLRWVLRLHRLVRRLGIDAVHSHSPLSAAFARVALRTLGRRRPRHVYTEHNTWLSYGRVTALANRITYRLDDAQVAVSEDARDSVPAGLRQHVEVLVHGVPLARVREAASQREAVRAELRVGDEHVLVVTVANFRRDKDYPTLLRAAAALADTPMARFVSVGQGPLADEVRRLHDELGLGDRVRFLGYRPDATSITAAADIFCLSSRHEGYPIAVMEALALGVPVVATAVGGVAVAIRDGQEGRLVPPGDPAALAEALRSVAVDPGLRKKMARAARLRSEDFSIDRAAVRLAEIYRGTGNTRTASKR